MYRIGGRDCTFIEVGKALLAIRDAKLYRKTHKTFEAYCRDRWEMSRPRAYQLIAMRPRSQRIGLPR